MDLELIDSYSDDDFRSLLQDLIVDKCAPTKSKHIVLGKSRKIVAKKIAKKRKIAVTTKSGSIFDFEACFPKPRILVSDIRRSYASMYVNALNSGQLPMVYGFLDSFGTPSFCHSMTFTVDADTTVTTKETGIGSFVNYWLCGVCETPDIALSIKDSTILTDDDGSNSRVSFNFELSATKVFDDPLQSCLSEVSDDNGSRIWSVSNEECPNMISMNDIARSIALQKQRLVLKEIPEKMSADGVITLFLDSCLRIVRLELVASAAQ